MQLVAKIDASNQTLMNFVKTGLPKYRRNLKSKEPLSLAACSSNFIITKRYYYRFGTADYTPYFKWNAN